MSREVHRTLPGHDYHADEVWQVERERIFGRRWVYVARVDALAEAGDCLAVEVGGEGILVVRGRDGALRGFHNVCRHRGAQLCDEGAHRLKGAIRCPYHAWAYAHDGSLIGTPNVAEDEVPRAELSLWPVHVDTWQGFVFACLAEQPEPLLDWLAAQEGDVLGFARFGLEALRTGHRTVSEVGANWKILIENYGECLHCPTVHPELVQVVPVYRSGAVYEEGRAGVALADGGDSFTLSGRSSLPRLPGMGEEEAGQYFGAVVLPNMFIDVTGTSAIATNMIPRGADRTTIVTEYLFTPEAIAAPGFDPLEVVEFSELVARQDYDVCERVQRGVRSRAFTHGVYAEKDDDLHAFNARYLELRGPLPG